MGKKGEIARNKQFFLFPQCFLLSQIIVSPCVHFFFWHHIFICSWIVRAQNWHIRQRNKRFSNVSQFFSSPEHEVLMVSFCDRSMSVVRRPSCIVHNFFKHLLLLNHWANLDETWQGCSLGEALPKLFKRLNSSHNSGCHGNQKEKNRKIFENLLLWN